MFGDVLVHVVMSSVPNVGGGFLYSVINCYTSTNPRMCSRILHTQATLENYAESDSISC